MIKILFFSFFLLLNSGISHCSEGITLWVHPYLSATELTSRFTPLTQYLSEKLNLETSIRINKSYQAHIDFVGQDKADLAYLGPVSYVKLKDNYGPKQLLAKLEVNREPFFHGVVIVRDESTIKKFEDLKGKSFAFGNPNSTMSHVVPRGMLKKAGIDLRLLKRYSFLNSHYNVVLSVVGGYFDAGAVKEEIFIKFKSRGIRVIAKSPPIPEHLFVARSDMPKELSSEIRYYLLNIEKNKKKRS